MNLNAIDIKFLVIIGCFVSLIYTVHHGFSTIDQWMVEIRDLLKDIDRKQRP